MLDGSALEQQWPYRCWTGLRHEVMTKAVAVGLCTNQSTRKDEWVDVTLTCGR